MYFCYFLIISPWTRAGPFNWINLNPLHQRMLCAKFGWDWPNGSEEEKWKYEKFTTTPTTKDWPYGFWEITQCTTSRIYTFEILEKFGWVRGKFSRASACKHFNRKWRQRYPRLLWVRPCGHLLCWTYLGYTHFFFFCNSYTKTSSFWQGNIEKLKCCFSFRLRLRIFYSWIITIVKEVLQNLRLCSTLTILSRARRESFCVTFSVIRVFNFAASS